MQASLAPFAPIGSSLHRADTHRGWTISFDYPPIPCRDFDWSATHPDYDCDCDEGGFFATSGAIVHGATREAVIAEIDLWHEENEA